MIAMTPLVAALAAQGMEPVKTCPDGSIIRASERCIEVPDHRKLYAATPPSIEHSVTWRCGKRVAQVRLRVSDVGGVHDGLPVRGANFKVELLDLRVTGATVSFRTLSNLRQHLVGLNGLSLLDGRCFSDDSPLLRVKGAGQDRFEIELR